ncbi:MULTISPECIES: deoxynucleoside kinase [Limnobacter]|uniref:Deoxyguanosine kinase/deoxyadenosine kinase n=1 Tax=Limnobacter litoralis TaxID=481366 RepID=A0ABQ5YVA6_9BURK|nr:MULTISPECIES: deoxynucleoside kinase [Limnobacter]GLR27191.1 deoxyguanosine kinase/deoxyadenosine kinase [Limnobacter litoralis]HEX5485048.1 deoxynucleoside kinase [Limnobacter sp.]
MLFEKYRHIVIEGPIGVGKTSLAKLMAERFNAELLLEQPQENPFLPKFYEDSARYALPTQLFFLFQRIGQLRDLAQRDFFESMVVSDFLLEKDRMFASLTLDEEELKLYQQIYQHQSPQTPTPDLVIYLQASPQILVERVHKRAIGYEQSITESYLAQLSEAYSRFFYHYDGAPLLIVNTEHLNPVDHPEDFDLLLSQIESMKGRREFFNWSE